MTTQTFTDTLVVVSCGASDCDVVFGMTERHYRARLADHRTWHCPNGHPRAYLGKSDAELARAERDQARRERDWARTARDAARDQAQAAHRSAAAHKGHATRLRNLIARGVCPVTGCRRNFADVRAHMATEHPGFHAHEDSDG